MTKPLYLLFFLLFLGFKTQSQNIIGVVDFMKVEDPNEYLEVEKLWQKIHEERIKQDMITGWMVCQVMYKTADDSYNFVSVSWYDAFSKLDKGVPESVLQAAYPEKNEADWKAFEERTNKSRSVISSIIFHQQLSCANGIDRSGLYYLINELNVKQKDSKEYLSIQKEIYKPLYEEDVRNKKRTNWSLWAKWPSDTDNFHYLSADGYTDLKQIKPENYKEYFNKIYPEKDFDEISTQIEALRILENSEMWKVIYRALR